MSLQRHLYLYDLAIDMTFVSAQFLVFYLVVVGVYFFLPYRARLLFLFAASFYFYAYWNASYIFLLLGTALVDYFAAILLEDTPLESTRRRKSILAMSMLVNLTVLFTFKYFNFFSASITTTLNGLGIPVDPFAIQVILPVGISFYTFQSMAYTIDVYRQHLQAERNIVRFLTFIAFFPQLVAGPIERATNLLPQFKVQHPFDAARTVEGLRYILWGAFKKMVIADRLAIYVNAVYNDVGAHTGSPLIMATVFFAIQIYCDFSGYTDIAIGTAKILGFNLMENFRQPYLAKSLTEFWARWHISLSTWFRDYLYIPLGGNRKGFRRNLINLFIVFLVSGLWHGANWTFVIWGAFHGVGVVIETIAKRVRMGKPALIPTPLRWALTMILVCLAWVFFRANTLQDAFYVLGNMFNFTGENVFAPFAGGLFAPQIEFWLSVGTIGFLMAWDYADNARHTHNHVMHTRTVFRWAAYYALGFAIMLSLVYGLASQEFIYFQF